MPASAAARVAKPLDELTLRRAQRGEQRAWRELIDWYQQPVRALIWRLLAGRAQHRVEDLAQETFVRVLRALPEFDPAGPASLSTWMLTIAARLTLNELRRPVMAALAEEPEVPGGDRADLGVERRQLAAAIGAGVAAARSASPTYRWPCLLEPPRGAGPCASSTPTHMGTPGCSTAGQSTTERGWRLQAAKDGNDVQAAFHRAGGIPRSGTGNIGGGPSEVDSRGAARPGGGFATRPSGS